MDGEAAGSPLEEVSSQRGLKRCHGGSSESSDDDGGGSGATRGAPRRAGIDAVEEEEGNMEAFVEEGVYAATRDDDNTLMNTYYVEALEPEEADAAPAQQLFDFWYMLPESEYDGVDLRLALGQSVWAAGASMVDHQEVDTTLRLGLGERDAHDASLAAWRLGAAAALQDGVGEYIPLYSNEEEDDGVELAGVVAAGLFPRWLSPPPPASEDSALAGDFLAFLEAHGAAPPPDDATAPSAGLDLNQPHAAHAAHLSPSDDDRRPEPCFFWPAFLAGAADDSHQVPDTAPAHDGRAAPDTNERPTVGLDLQSSSAGTCTPETSENRARRCTT